MNRSLLWLRRASFHPVPLWLLATVLLGAAMLAGVLGLSLTATGQAIEDPQPTSIQSASQGTVYTHTLPIVFKGYWEADESLLGIQLYALNYPNVVKTAQAGASWVRLPLSWGSIEPTNTTPDHYQWPGSWEAQLAHLSSRNAKPILTLDGNPSWAATYSSGPIDQADIGELVEFMQAAVARYSAPPYNVKHWEIYNEVDNGDELYAEWGWGYFGNQPDLYVDLLAAVYGPMKAVDPEAQIVFSGLAYDWWTTSDPPGPFVEAFLDEVLARGGSAFFDVMNFHYYPAFNENWNDYGQDIIGKTAFLRSKLAEYDVDKPFICTETSMWSDELHGGSEELQSRYVPQVFARSMAADLETTIWLMLADDKGLGAWKYGLLHPDLSPKPAYYAYQTLARQLSPADYVRTLDDGETGSEWIEAYEFLTRDGLTRIVVAWSNDEVTRTMPLTASQAVVVDKMGAETTVLDGDDGAVDGVVHVTIDPSPVYLRMLQ